MATFTYIPSSTSRLAKKPRMNKVQFGNGYSQRAGDGINSITEKWGLVFSVRDNTDADAIIAFLDAREGHESFDWTPPGGSAGKYICDTYARTYTKALDMNQISATFERVYEA